MSYKVKKICIVVHSRANYGRIKSVLTAIRQHAALSLQLVVASSALLIRYGNVREVIEGDGFKIDKMLYSVVEGEAPIAMAKSTALAISELASVFDELKPDVVLTVADRYETMATAIAASYMNIPLAHTQGGEVTGSIDESVRHAITKLAHIHFPATKRAAEYVMRMGESPKSIFLTGCPALDIIYETDLSNKLDTAILNKGVGREIDVSQPYVLVLQHPVTTEYSKAFEQINHTLRAIDKLAMQAVWLWPNVDAGSDDIAKGIRLYRESNPESKIHFYRNFRVEDYLKILNNCACIIGNSSSAIREGALLGVPAVNIGSRQSLREMAENVVCVANNTEQIYAAIIKQLQHGRYESSSLYGSGMAGKKIADILATTEMTVQKKLDYVFRDQVCRTQSVS